MAWTPEQYAEYLRQQNKAPAAKPSKYRNVRVVVDGITFDSKKEANYWLTLKAREKAGEIFNLCRQVRFPLYCPDPSRESDGLVVAEYLADFCFFVYAESDRRRHVVDVKGQKKRACPYPLKKKWLELQEGIPIEEV